MVVAYYSAFALPIGCRGHPWELTILCLAMLPLIGSPLPCHSCRHASTGYATPEVGTVWYTIGAVNLVLFCCIGWNVCGMCMVVPCVGAAWYCAGALLLP